MGRLSPTQWQLLARALGEPEGLTLRDGNAGRTARALRGRQLLHRTADGRWQITLAGLQSLLDRDRQSPAKLPRSTRAVLAQLSIRGTFDPQSGGERWAAEHLVGRGAATSRDDGTLAPTPLGRQQGARELRER